MNHLASSQVPASESEVAAILRDAAASNTPVYPVGGGTALEFGLPIKTPGIELSLAALNRVIDYPARDMTITVEAGITMSELSRTLAAEGQRLPVDAPFADRATLGGVIATNHSGPLRYGHGTIRDYVIGISAVDGMGRPFKGGGRVVKNVAGYDFCKLLVGSLGTLGVVTQITLKVKPLPVTTAMLACEVDDWQLAERLLAGLVQSATTPAMVELLAGPAFSPDGVAQLGVGLEGTEVEVAWMRRTIVEEWRRDGGAGRELSEAEAKVARERLVKFPALGKAPLVLKAAIRPSAVTSFAQLVLSLDPDASLQAHAGNGIVIVSFANVPAGSISQSLIAKLQPAAAAAGGHVVVLSSSSPGDLTRQAMWGMPGDSLDVMRSIKRQFDPADILNRGRFVF